MNRLLVVVVMVSGCSYALQASDPHDAGARADHAQLPDAARDVPADRGQLAADGTDSDAGAREVTTLEGGPDAAADVRDGACSQHAECASGCCAAFYPAGRRACAAAVVCGIGLPPAPGDCGGGVGAPCADEAQCCWLDPVLRTRLLCAAGACRLPCQSAADCDPGERCAPRGDFSVGTCGP